MTIVPGANLGGWTHAGDEAAIRSAVTRIVPAAKIERMARGALLVTTPDKTSAARLAKVPRATFAGWTPVAALDCE